MNPTDTIDHLRLVRAEGVGPVAYRRLLARYGSAAAALAALPELARAGGRATPAAIPTLADARMVWLTLAMAVLIFLRHHENIRRLLAGTEPRIGRKG